MKKTLLLAVLSGWLLTGFVPAPPVDYRYHAIFMYNFTKYIQWPAAQQSGDFVIGVLGNSPVVEELTKVTTNKVVGAQKIIVKKLATAGEVSNCHMVFIPESSSGSLDAVLGKLQHKPTLVITEKNGLVQKGSGINFVMQDNKWKFELNEAATQSAGLKISKELAQMAING